MLVISKQSLKYNTVFHAPNVAFEMDEKTFKSLPKGLARVTVEQPVDENVEQPVDGLTDEKLALRADLLEVDGVEENFVNELIEKGFETVADLQAATVEQLTEIKGIGDATANKIIADAAEFE